MWEKQLSTALNMTLSTSYTHYFSTYKQKQEDSYGTKGATDYEYSLSEKNTKNSIDDIDLKALFSYNKGAAHLLRFGLEYTWHKFIPEQQRNRSTHNNVVWAKPFNSQVNGHEFAAFAEDDIKICDRFNMNLGARMECFRVNKKAYFAIEPRISARLSISSAVSIKSGYSRMSQFVQQVSNSYVNLPTDFWVPISAKFKPLTSDQVSLGAYCMVKQGLFLSLEGYYKWMQNLLEYSDKHYLVRSGNSWEDKLSSGKGRAYGADLIVEKKTGKITGFLGYGLLWTHRKFNDINRGKEFPAKYDNRHKINISANWTIKKNVELNAAWTFMSGNRVTVSVENYKDITSSGFPTGIAPDFPYSEHTGLNHFDTKNNVRLPAYHRLDLGINFYRPKKGNRMGIWNISVYNAYSRMNPITIEKNTQEATMEGKPLKPRFRTLAIFPVIPSVSYTYKF